MGYKEVTLDRRSASADTISTQGGGDVLHQWIDPTNTSTTHPKFLYGRHNVFNAWTAGTGTVRWSLQWTFSTPYIRTLSASWAMYIDSWNLNPLPSTTETRTGIWFLKCADNALNNLGYLLGVKTTQDANNLGGALKWTLRETATSAQDESTDYLYWNLYKKRWLIFYIEAESVTNGSVYDIGMRQSIYLDEGGQLKQISHMSLDVPGTDVFGFTAHEIGLQDSQKNRDVFSVYYDELRWQDSHVLVNGAHSTRARLPVDRFTAYPKILYTGVGTSTTDPGFAIMAENGDDLYSELGSYAVDRLIQEGTFVINELLLETGDFLLQETEDKVRL